jgi:dephospho-CoA kinase
MKFLVLGLTGKRGCGKDTMAKYLRKKYGFRTLTFTDDVLAPLLKKMGKDVTRGNLIDLALEMRKQSGNDVLAKMLCKKIEKKRKGFWAISGVRYPEEVECFKKHFDGNFKLVKIECETKKRYERVRKRATKGEKNLSFKEFLEIDKKATERPIENTMKLADFSIDNNTTFKAYYQKIDEVMRKLKINLKVEK